MERRQAEGLYIVRLGDTLGSIALHELGASSRYPDILALNRHIRNPNQIYEGDFILLPPRRDVCTVNTVWVNDELLADLREASDHFKTMPYAHRQSLSEHGESTALLTGVLKELDGREAYSHVLSGAASVQLVAERVQVHVRNVTKMFTEEIERLKQSYPRVKLNSSDAYDEVLKIQARADRSLTKAIGETMRSRLPDSRFETSAFRDFIRNRGEMPVRFTDALKNTEGWLKQMSRVGSAIVVADAAMSAYDCWKDLRNGADDLSECSRNLGGFAAGTSFAYGGALLLGSLSLGGVPLIAATLGIVGASAAAAYAGKWGAKFFYNLVNG